ncbi:envelope stress response membrane protein PspB [Mangrovimicrobium sediminis]|uniref:Envelope stress response membrane protein PspB n=1 Tax=Mangrovimicrobium sediminis TaxID=2562682 RepID=A0A4Z0M6Z0_9GAMM|nr:envelope stress response membrane protein PspB [Haliea sp. SAOS-164]TGD75157.1 envelope stress response membrane protein PspB [Haliea sp. SAOS-164]
MQFWNFMLAPTILFMVVVAPIWITMHYRSLNRSSRSLSEEDRETVEHMLETVDTLAERIATLESLLDADHPEWRDSVRNRSREEEHS